MTQLCQHQKQVPVCVCLVCVCLADKHLRFVSIVHLRAITQLPAAGTGAVSARSLMLKLAVLLQGHPARPWHGAPRTRDMTLFTLQTTKTSDGWPGRSECASGVKGKNPGCPLTDEMTSMHEGGGLLECVENSRL